MPKPSDDIQKLKRCLTYLARLEGRALACAEGAVLLEPVRVRDPRPLVEACLAGRPPLAALRSTLELASTLVSLTPRLLAAAQRDLRMLESSPGLVALTRETPRIFRRYGTLDAAWIEHKRARLARLAEVMGAVEVTSSGGHPPWFLRVLDVIRFLYGDAGCHAIEQGLERLFKDEESHRRALHRMLDALLEGIEGGRAPRERPIAEALQALREVESLPGRSRARKVAQVLAQLLDLPLLNEGHALDRSLALVPLVRTLGQEMLSRIPSPRSPAFQDKARRFLACFGLAFDPRPRDGGTLPVSRAIVEDSLRELDPLLKRFGGRKLTLAEVLVLSSLTRDHGSSAITSLVEAGLSIEKVRKLATLGRLKDLEKLPRDPATAEAYVDWASTLVPHYAALGLDLPLDPGIFEKLRVPRREDLAVLAVCLMKHHTGASPETSELALARLDATLGLFQRRPAEAASLIAELSGTSPGAGRAAFPEFAAWLGDDALLDRFVHLSRLAGTPITLSQRLRIDFERDERRAHQRDHLKELRTRSAAQEKRLARLEASSVPAAAPGKTRRRLTDRVRELTALAYERRLDAVFLRILKEVWGISLMRLEPGWRDAIRFYLAVDDNRELLGTLLRAAAGGLDVARTLPKNRAWLAKARLHFNVDAWLAPRSRDVSLGGKPYRIAVEQDPIEVLRMGIPFDTCLSLEKGSNSASTIVNAVDANKRVIYLRDARGQIVARKLLAVSSEYTLLGYRLYIAESMHREAITRAFREFCGELATAARLRFDTSGKPLQLHPGFWYDDGVVAEEGAPGGAPVEAYCESLGMPPPRVVTERLRREARVFDALRREGEAAVLASLRPYWRALGSFARAAQWLLARVPPEHLVEKMRSCSSLAALAIRRAAEEGPLAMFELAGRAADPDTAQEAADLLFRFPRTVEVARALINAALASKRNPPRFFNDHGLEHQTIYLMPAFAAELPVMALFELCDRVEPIWRWVAQVGNPHCAKCVEYGEPPLIEAIVRHYASERDPACVIRQLGRSRSSKLSRRAALHIAARYALCEEASVPTLAWPRLEPVRPSASALRALSRLRKREPEWDAEPEMLAALLRQSGGGPLPHGTTLPVPRKAPFGALGDLLLQLDLTSVIAHWPQPTQDLARQRHLAEAFACIDRHLAGRAEAPEAIATALKEVQEAELPWTDCQPIVKRLLMRQGQRLTQAEQSFITWYLGEKTSYRHPQLTPEMIVAAWQVEGLRGALARALGQSEREFFTFPLECIESTARRMGGLHLVSGLVEAVMEALLAKGAYETLGEISEESLFRRAVRLALSKGVENSLEDGAQGAGVLPLSEAQVVARVAGVVALYKGIDDHSHAAWFLEELSRSPLLGTTKEFDRELGFARRDWDATHMMPLEWLEACVERSRPGRS